jgi:plasmid maintenance system antidote protein VapI
LTRSYRSVTIDTMKPIGEILREAIRKSSQSLQRLSELTGVQRASLSRFVRGERTLRLDMAERLAEYFGLELRPTRKRRQHERDER